MINEQLLVDNGYKRFEDQIYPYSNRFYQKRVKDPYGVTKYFINCYIYEFPVEKEPRYDFEVFFEKNKLTYRITIYGKTSLNDVETEIERLWLENNFNYYE